MKNGDKQKEISDIYDERCLGFRWEKDDKLNVINVGLSQHTFWQSSCCRILLRFIPPPPPKHCFISLLISTRAAKSWTHR